jgi:hypothetical protein
MARKENNKTKWELKQQSKGGKTRTGHLEYRFKSDRGAFEFMLFKIRLK